MTVTEVICVHCNKSFNKDASAYNRTVRKKNRHFCSRECASVGRKSKLRKCEICGTWAKTGNKFCSKPCYTIFQKSKPKKDRATEGVVATDIKCRYLPCTNTVIKRYRTLQKYCSSHCGIRHQGEISKQNTYSNSPLCKNCGEHIGRSKGKFCDNECFIVHKRKHSKNIDYRKIAFDNFPNLCNRCGIDITVVLEVHHKDRDRNNNHLNNLEILCANCHLIEHRAPQLSSRAAFGQESSFLHS